MGTTPRPLGVLGRFDLLEELGHGRAFGTYRARKHGVQGFEKILVLKIPLPQRSADPGFTSLLVGQAGIAALLSHANIVQIIEVAEEADSPMIALEYVHGMDLETLVRALQRSGQRMPSSLAAFVMGEVCKALDFSHRKGRKGRAVSHGALHARNVLLSYEGEVKVADFLISDAVLSGEPAHPAEDVAAAGSMLASLLALSDDATQDLESAALAAQALDAAGRPDAAELFRSIASALFATRERPRPRELATFLTQVGLRPPPIETGRIDIRNLPGHTPTPHDEALDPTAPDVLRDAFGVSPTLAFIGRQAEAEALGKVFDEVLGGSARVAVVHGPAGVGKTRLLAQFGRSAIRAGAAVAALSLTPEATGLPLFAIRLLTRALVGVPPEPGESDPLDVRQLIREFALTPYETEIVRGLTLGEDGIGLAPSDRVRPIARVLRRLVTRLTADAALVVLVDDMQHLDPLSRAVLDELVRRAQDRPILVCGSKPPTRKEKEIDGALLIPLGPMTGPEIGELLAIRSGPAVGEVWRERMAEASGGNPRIAVDLDLVAADLPPENREELLASPTAEQLAMDRLGRLPAHQRQALGIAAQIGTSIDPALCARVMSTDRRELGAMLESLADAGILSRRPGKYSFASEALHRAAEREISRSELPALHRFVALALAEERTGDPHVWAAALVDHANRGAARGTIAGQLAARGRQLAAAGAGVGLDLLLEALRASRDEMERDARPALDLSLEVGELALRLGRYHEGIAALRFGRVLARRADDPPLLLTVLQISARLYTRAERYSEAFRLLEEAHGLAERSGDATAIAESHGGIGETLTQMGEFQRARPYLETALQYAEPMGHAAARLHGYLGLVTAAGGDALEARKHLARVEAIRSEQPHDAAAECQALKWSGLIAYALGDVAGAVAAFEVGLRRSMELGFHHEAAVAAINLADSQLRHGHGREAFASVRYAYEVARELGFPRVRSMALYLLGFIEASVLQSPEGRDKVEREALEARTPWDILQKRFALGRIDAQLGRRESAITQLREALEVGRRTGNLMLEPDIQELLRSLGSDPG